jgi:hypothetical protein
MEKQQISTKTAKTPTDTSIAKFSPPRPYVLVCLNNKSHHDDRPVSMKNYLLWT